MIKEQATVVDIAGEFAWVETQRQTACGACSANKGCGTHVISKVVGNRRNRVRVLNTINAEIGDRIIVGLEEGALVKGSLALYFVPLLGLFGGGAFGGVLFSNFEKAYTDGWQILFALGGLVLGVMWLKGFSGRISTDKQYQAVALEKVGAELKFIRRAI